MLTRAMNSESLDWNPDLHPRDTEGKFAEKPGRGVSLNDAREAYTSITKSINVGGKPVDASPVIREGLSSDTSELKEAVGEELNPEYISESSFGPDKHGSSSQFEGWREERGGSLLNEATAELWGAAIDETGNDNVPSNATATPNTVGEPLPAAEGGDPVTALGDNIKVTRETLRKIFGDSVPVVRGVTGEFAERLREAKENGNEVEINHRALESWSTFPDHAQQFAQEGDGDGVFITTEIPIDQVYGASHTTPGLHEEENEIVAALDESVSYSPEQIKVADDSGAAEVYNELAAKAK